MNGVVNVWLVPIFWFGIKVIALTYGTVWLRAATPRMRYDRLMSFCWKYLIELAVLWVIVLTACELAIYNQWNVFLVTGATILAGAALDWSADAHDAEAGRDGRGVPLMGLARGFGVVISQLGRRKRVTTEYPEEKTPKPPRLHGRHVLNRYEDGMEKCIGCELCAGVCPARCIYVRGKDNPTDVPVSPGERTGSCTRSTTLRCIHCDMCVEACPTEAITETKLFEFSFTNRCRCDLHEERAPRGRRGSGPASAVGALARSRGRRHIGVDARDGARWPGRLRGPCAVVGRARLRSAAARAGPTRRRGVPCTRRPSTTHLHMGAGNTMPVMVVTCEPGAPSAFFVFAIIAVSGALGVAVARQPGALGAVPRDDHGHDGRVLPRSRRAARGDRADRGLRERDRRAVPVRDHVARLRSRANPAFSSEHTFQRPLARSWALGASSCCCSCAHPRALADRCAHGGWVRGTNNNTN